MKNLLKDPRLVINVVLTAICAVVFLGSLILHYGNLKDTVAVSGPLGDTFGGLFSPVIGLITFVLVYRTFQDQHSSNNHSKSATDLDLLLKALERHYQNLDIEYPASFKDLHNPADKTTIPNVLDIFLYTDGQVFLNKVIDKLGSVVLLIDSTTTFNLTSQHKAFFLNESKIVLGRFFELYHPTLHQIQDKFKNLPEQEEPFLNDYVRTERGSDLDRIPFNSNINSYSKFLLSYHELIERLKTLDLIQTTTIETVPAKDFFEPDPINFDLVNKIRQKPLFDIKITSPS
ncbi:hypothetical protein FHS57_005001 [Runella defluvii]|uniref:Uncharacterized protein n=1 Tax=Runella defluvii TaxID=370973 RepID=A0A7W5ZP11_9BACT|nr:hypothetical protein [Runella defluvii]MBB3840980.1 hypothetical protein [Runella defluvii]